MAPIAAHHAIDQKSRRFPWHAPTERRSIAPAPGRIVISQMLRRILLVGCFAFGGFGVVLMFSDM
jgi:hypothetical protein